MSTKFSFRRASAPAAEAPAADPVANAKPVTPVEPPKTVEQPISPAVAQGIAQAAATEAVQPAPQTTGPTYAQLKAAGLADAQIAALGVAIPASAVPVDPRRAALRAAGLTDAQIDIALAVPAAAAPAGVVPPAAPAGAIVPANSNVLVENRQPARYADDVDDLTASDVKMPRINLVANVGPLSETHTPGQLLYAQELVLVNPPPKQGDADQTPPVPVEMVVCGFRKDRYVEKTDGSEMGDICDTVEEVVKKGGTVDYNEAKATDKPLYQRLAECVVLVALPPGKQHGAFTFVADGKKWAPAVWAMKGGAFTNGAKVIRTARKGGFLTDIYDISGNLVEKRGYTAGLWKVSTKLEKYRTGNSGWIPVFKEGGVTSPELRALAQQLV